MPKMYISLLINVTPIYLAFQQETEEECEERPSGPETQPGEGM